MQLSSYNSSSNASILATCVGVPFQSFTDAYSTGKAIVVSARSGATVFPKFETALGARSLGRHHVFHIPRAFEVLSRSGATVFIGHQGRLERAPARAPPCFSCSECAWRTPPLGRHRVSHSPKAPEVFPRSGATVFFHTPGGYLALRRSGATVFLNA